MASSEIKSRKKFMIQNRILGKKNHETFRLVSRLPRYISCYIWEGTLHHLCQTPHPKKGNKL